MKLRLIWIWLIPLLFVDCSPKITSIPVSPIEKPAPVPMATKPKNLIFMIGDGMGLSQISAGIFMNNNFLNLERLPYIGLIKCYSSDNLITDSAAGATAFACGVKTYNNAVGVDANGIPQKTILESAEEKKLATGIVVTSTLVNATPAAFIAHQKLRGFSEAIAADYLKTEVDFLVGGGKKYFDRRNDDRNLYQELQENDYLVYDYFTHKDLTSVEMDFDRNFVYFTADDDPLPVTSGRDYLYAASVLGMKFLDKHSDKGFFMMIEGSQIDWGGHANNEEFVITELLDFDKTIGAVLDFAEQDGETLVVITADHETGGMAINPGSKFNKIKTEFTTGKHTAALVPVFAYGPGAEIFSGVYENTDIYNKMMRALGLPR